jgi:HEAT repeat protein
MKKLLYVASFVGAFMLVASVALAHGGNYSGPGGGGTSGGFAPGGGGTPGPGGGPGGGGTPDGGGGPGGGGTTGPGGGGGGGGPTGPGGGGGAGGGLGGGVGGTLGGATGGMRKKAASDANVTWAAWWFFNDDKFLQIRAKTRTSEIETENADLFLGEDASDAAINKVPWKKIRQEVIPKLQIALKDPFFDVRAAAAIALGKCGMPDSRPYIEATLNDEDKRVRESACLALGILGNKDAVPTLIGIMNNDQESRRKLGRGTSDILPRTRAFAAIAIGLIGRRNGDMSDTKAVEALTKLLLDKRANKAHVDLEVGPIVALGLMKSKESVPMLIDFLKDDDNRFQSRGYAATTLGKIGDPSATDVLIKMLKDKQNEVVQSSAMALGQLIDKDDKKRNRQLQRMTKVGKDLAAKNFSVMSMGLIGGEDNRNFLFGLLKGNNFEQTFGALALGVYFYNNPDDAQKTDVAKTLHKAFKNTKSPDERGAYAIAMGLMKYEPAGKDLMKVVEKGGQASMRSHLCLALGLIDYDDAIPLVREIVKEKGDIDLRRNAAITLGLLGDRTAMDFLQKEMERSENSLAVLGAVTQGLGFIGDVAAVPKLNEMATDRKKYKDNTRAFSAVALGLLGDKDDIPILFAIAENNNYIARTDAIGEVLTIL